MLAQAIEEHGLRRGEFEINEDATRKLIRNYTRSLRAGMKRELASPAARRSPKSSAGKAKQVKITPDNLADFAGVERASAGIAEMEDQIGVVTGLAWTEVGGELLTIEGVMLPGKAATTTGKLGDVMKESINAASSYVRSRSTIFGIEPPLFERKDIHVHVPKGATPKDGPSAGTAMATAIVSVMTGIPVRKEVAMTGEVTLRGRVLPIGGLKENCWQPARRYCQGSHPRRMKKTWRMSLTISRKGLKSCRLRAWMKCCLMPCNMFRRRLNGMKKPIMRAAKWRPETVGNPKRQLADFELFWHFFAEKCHFRVFFFDENMNPCIG